MGSDPMSGVPGSALFCDRLCLGSCVAAITAKLTTARDTGWLLSLDPLPGPVGAFLLACMIRPFGLRAREVPFFAGHLKDPHGESVYRAARKTSAALSFDAAASLMEREPSLRELNRRHGRDTVRLHLAKRLWPELEGILRRSLVAQALSPASDKLRVLLRRPSGFDPATLAQAADFAEIRHYGRWRASLYAWSSALEGIWMAAAQYWRTRPTPTPLVGRRKDSAVLVLQEDELGTDRTVRTQPHWLFPEDPRPAHRTCIWMSQKGAPNPARLAGLEAIGVEPLGANEVARLARAYGGAAVPVALRQRGVHALLAALSRLDAPAALALAGAGKLLLRSATAAALCEGVGATMTLNGEPHLVDADALLVAGFAMGIPSVAYQYSNISLISPAMMTTADLMLLFSPQYGRNWQHHGIRPGLMADIGYPYDRVFPVLKARAAAHRASLADVGATFVLCFFDENITDGKYGQMSPEDHAGEIRSLAKLVLSDPTVGVIVKTQFARNSPGRLYAGDPILAAAISTKRYVDLYVEGNRNMAFPAEAALAADLAIGHVVGATAPLEAALSGCRCVLLNRYESRGTWDDLYGQGDIVFQSIEEMLEAVSSFRKFDPAHMALGDWSGFLPAFDRHRDGGAADRLRNVVASIAAGSTPEAACAGILGPFARESPAGHAVVEQVAS